MGEPLTPDELADVRRRWPHPTYPQSIQERLLATVDAERARANQAETERDAAHARLADYIAAVHNPDRIVGCARQEVIEREFNLIDAETAAHRAATGDQP